MEEKVKQVLLWIGLVVLLWLIIAPILQIVDSLSSLLSLGIREF